MAIPSPETFPSLLTPNLLGLEGLAAQPVRFDASPFDRAQLPSALSLGQSEFTWFIVQGVGRSTHGPRRLAFLFCLHRTGPRFERSTAKRGSAAFGLSALLAPLGITTDERPLLMAAVYDLDHPERPPRVVERTVEPAAFDPLSFSGVSGCGRLQFSQFTSVPGTTELPLGIRSYFAAGGFGAALRATFDDAEVELFLRPTKPLVAYGAGGSPEIQHGDVVTSYVQRTRLDVSGRITLRDGQSEERVDCFAGKATQDHQWFKVTNPLLKWIWPHIRLKDGRELMGYVLRDSSAGRWAKAEDGREIGRGGWLVEPNGHVVPLPTFDVCSVPAYDQRTARGGHPTRFLVTVPELGIRLTLEHLVKDAFLPMRAFGSCLDAGAWEAPARILDASGTSTEGHAWVEVVNAATARLGR